VPLLTLRIRGESEHPKVSVTDAEAARVHAMKTAGPQQGREWATAITDVGGDRFSIGLADVLWVTETGE